MKYRLFLVFFVLLAITCSASAEITVKKTPSGKEIKILGVGKMHFTKGDPALALKYQTDIDIDDVDLLRNEVEEIWSIFRVDVERSGLTTAIVMPTSPSVKVSPIVSTDRSYNFVATRRENGTWNLNSWKRDYDGEARELAEEYLESFRNGDVINAAKAYHFPDYLTSEQLRTELASISTALGVVASEFGVINSYVPNSSPIVYQFLEIQSASHDFWRKHLYLYGLIYDVEYSKKGSGYILFRFSVIRDNIVINSILHALPGSDANTEAAFRELYGKIAE